MKRSVLLIEDNPQNRYLEAFLLEARGYAVSQAVDGRQGVDMARANPPDVILLDIQLPKMDGHAVARELRACRSLDAVAVIAVTSYAMKGDREKALEAGCDGYIEKPIDPETFVSVMEGIVRGGRP